MEAAEATACSRSFKSCLESAFFASGLFNATQYTPAMPLAFCIYACVWVLFIAGMMRCAK